MVFFFSVFICCKGYEKEKTFLGSLKIIKKIIQMNNPIFNFSIEEDIKVEIYLQKVTIINKHIK